MIQPVSTNNFPRNENSGLKYVTIQILRLISFKQKRLRTPEVRRICMGVRRFAIQSRSSDLSYKSLYFSKKILPLHFAIPKMSILVNLSSHILPLIRIRIRLLFVALNYGKFHWRANTSRLYTKVLNSRVYRWS